uniref:Uncharacterized protein n=1 Tax=Xenopus tropicalis TaxID=8364 RepID=A0A6I8S284_XENTR
LYSVVLLKPSGPSYERKMTAFHICLRSNHFVSLAQKFCRSAESRAGNLILQHITHVCPTGTHVCPTGTHVCPTGTHVCPTGTHVCPTGTHVCPTGTHVCPTGTHVCPTLTHVYPTGTHVCPTHSLTYSQPPYTIQLFTSQTAFTTLCGNPGAMPGPER